MSSHHFNPPVPATAGSAQGPVPASSSAESVERTPVRTEDVRRFDVRYSHRVIFTEDIFGADRGRLHEFFVPTPCDEEEDRLGRVVPKVQWWLDERVAKAHPRLFGRLQSWTRTVRDTLAPAGIFSCPGGEEVKNDWRWIERILEAVHEHGLDRRSYIGVIGGGAVLDAVGFAAATAHRGIRLVRFPTTTLAQADSGIGVKNAVNRFGKKNWLGTFAVPWAVVNDAALLESLPDRQFIEGFSEAVKVTLLKSERDFVKLSASAARIRKRMPEDVRWAIRRSAELHLRHITDGGDPFENLEARPLDYGHWSAHRLESLTRFTLSHGEAVGIGVAIDSVYSSLKFGFPESDLIRLFELYTELGLPLFHEVLAEPDSVFSGLEEFREHLGGRLTVTMLRRIGEPIEVHEIDEAAMRESISRVRTESVRRERRAGSAVNALQAERLR